MGQVRNLRERINVYLFNIRERFFRVINILALIASLSGVGIIIYFFGFSPDANTTLQLTSLLQRVLDFFLIKFLLQLFFDFNPLRFLKKNIWESIIMFAILTESIIYFAFGEAYWLQLAQIAGLSVNGYFLVVQILFWVIIIRESGRTSLPLKDFRISPAALLALSFLMLILIGTALLKMPEMTKSPISWADALFTATSASCVTGLIVQDTATFFTFKGQLTIMLLFQLGGLNMLTIATFIGSFYRKSGSLQTIHLMRDFLDTRETGTLTHTLRKVIYYSFFIEMAGAVLLYFTWGNQAMFHNTGERIFQSVFHAVSAFNNAGFSIFSNGLFEESVRFSYGAHIVIMVLIIAGGLGFVVLQDLFNKSEQRTKRRYWGRLSVNTRLVISVTGLLFLFGAVLFFIFENNNTLASHSTAGKVITALFQSATTRTAGFNTVDTSMLSIPTLLLFMFLMFIGANPGSTGGGIKTTTFGVALKATWANLRGKEHVEVFKRNIQWASVNKTYAIIILAVTFIFVFSTLLSVTNPGFSFREILFEQISAMGTVGLSLGITGELTTAGKMIIVVSMFVGRIGSLTMAILFSRKTISKNYRYANANLMIG
ncbi:MAG: TrkH family potassium uptake protein [Bacteroidota bacterium]